MNKTVMNLPESHYEPGGRMGPLVSAIVPFYNVEEFLDDCLRSIARQTYSRFECLLVDDGSPDSSRAIAEKWAANDDRFQIITQANAGLGAARNTGTAQARGEYLIFLDSDDLLAPRAFEQFVTSLEESGSDFAGAHIWRLPLTRPVEGSWAHTEPFAERRQRTSIREIPLLMRDRMAWNKMWRRSFWDAGGYSWPEMKFEDFPVTIRAHLEAEAVDTLNDPVYVWRERPVGQSISGQGKSLDNVTDRVRAAQMVIETVDAKATSEVRELVHSHLVDVDLREVMSSMLTAHPDDRPAIDALAHELALAIDPALVSLAQPDLQAAYRAARDNDLDEVHTLARARFAPSQPSQSTVAKVQRAPKALKTRAAKLSSQAGHVQGAHLIRERTATLVDYHLDDFSVTYRIDIPLSDTFKRKAKVVASLGSTEMTVQQAITPTGVLCDLRVDTREIAVRGGFQPLTFEAHCGAVRFAGHVAAPTSLLHGFHRAGYWVQARNQGGRFGVNRLRRATLMSNVRLDEQGRLAFDISAGSEIAVQMPWPTPDAVYPVTPSASHNAASLPTTSMPGVSVGTVTIDVERLVASDPADNPVTDIASRRLVLRTATGDEPLHLIGDGLRWRAARRDVELLRADDGTVYLVHRPLPDAAKPEEGKIR